MIQILYIIISTFSIIKEILKLHRFKLYLPFINIAGESLFSVVVIPRACHGSIDPWTYTTRLVGIFKAPYALFVQAATSSTKLSTNLEQ